MNTEPDDAFFLVQRPRLFGIAYRMLGSVAEADDVLQDAWVRWHQLDTDGINNTAAYLTRIVTNLSIDSLRRAKSIREDYPGPWLPQPIVEELETDASDGEVMTDLAKSLSVALLAVLETVPPHERATFVLREAFEMSFDEIATVLDAKPATCRQWSKRARDRLRGVDWRDSSPALDRRLLERFVTAITTNDVDGLVELLDPNVVLISDGGGKVAAARRPLHGMREVSRFLTGVSKNILSRIGGRMVKVNGDWGGLVYIDGVLDAVYSIRSQGDRISGIYILRNPDKLQMIGAGELD